MMELVDRSLRSAFDCSTLTVCGFDYLTAFVPSNELRAFEDGDDDRPGRDFRFSTTSLLHGVHVVLVSAAQWYLGFDMYLWTVFSNFTSR